MLTGHRNLVAVCGSPKQKAAANTEMVKARGAAVSGGAASKAGDTALVCHVISA